MSSNVLSPLIDLVRDLADAAQRPRDERLVAELEEARETVVALTAELRDTVCERDHLLSNNETLIRMRDDQHRMLRDVHAAYAALKKALYGPGGPDSG